jgi:hypothetical protein
MGTGWLVWCYWCSLMLIRTNLILYSERKIFQYGFGFSRFVFRSLWTIYSGGGGIFCILLTLFVRFVSNSVVLEEESV